MTRLWPLALVLAGCYPIKPKLDEGLSSFAVVVKGVFTPGATRTPLAVVSTCAQRHGGQDKVPAELRGTRPCPYAIPRGELEIDLKATALDRSGLQLPDFFGPVSFRVVPGDLTGDYPHRWAQSHSGVAEGTVKVAHLFGEVRAWAEDAPPQPIYADGGLAGNTQVLPVEPERRTFASGLSGPIVFEDPTLAKVQIPDGWDNRSSPLVGQFLTIGKNPESGQVLVQSCPDDPSNDGQPLKMVVTGTDPGGFFVTDLTACRLVEEQRDPVTGSTLRTSEPNEPCVPSGTGLRCAVTHRSCQTSADCPPILPGTFGSMFIYNYSFPEGLNVGDLLFTLSGSVQEFTSTTQLTFPAWTIAERVRELPQDQWDKWLKYAKPTELNLRHCGLDNTASAFVTDTMCGHNRRNMKVESLESALVKVRNVKFPQVFTNCDFNADATVPFFCEQTAPVRDPNGNPYACDPAAQPSNCAAPSFCDRTRLQCVDWTWGSCDFTGAPEAPNEVAERNCNIDCASGRGPHTGVLCAERATFATFGQFVVELSGPGPDAALLDTSLPARLQEGAVGPNSTAVPVAAGSELRLFCDVAVRYRLGDAAVSATSADPELLAQQVLSLRAAAGQTHLALIATAAGRCTRATNTHTRINVVTKDAVPELAPDCREDDPDPARATQCRNLRGARYDITGHLRHLQPGRPRWVILPRDVDDICCRPGPGLVCPRPIKPCK